jgi:hypothetical protein
MMGRLSLTSISSGAGHPLAFSSFPSDEPESDRALGLKTRYISLRENATSCLAYLSTGEIPIPG